jgi:hypothetical protein
MNAGDTFFLWIKAADCHLWVIISDPTLFPDAVLIASFTTYTCDQEDACLLDAGEHRHVTHKTCVSYGHARKTTAANLCQLRNSGKIEMKDPVSPQILQRIRLGASRSRRIAVELIELMGHQGLLD